MTVIRFPGRGRRSGLWKGSFGERRMPPPSTWVWGAATLLTIATGTGAMLWLGAKSEQLERDPTTLCLTHSPPPSTSVVLVDQTDALAQGSGARFLSIMSRIKTRLPRDGRLVIVPFGGDLSQSLSPVLDVCSPGTGLQADQFEGSQRVQRLYDRKFAAPLDRVAKQLQEPHESRYSPIAEQIERIINDPAIGWSGKRELIIISDGLQHSPESRIYEGRAVRMPPPIPGLLKDVTVRYYELVNPERGDLQTPEVRAALQSWLSISGAAVKMYAPGYPDPDVGG